MKKIKKSILKTCRLNFFATAKVNTPEVKFSSFGFY